MWINLSDTQCICWIRLKNMICPLHQHHVSIWSAWNVQCTILCFCHVKKYPKHSIIILASIIRVESQKKVLMISISTKKIYWNFLKVLIPKRVLWVSLRLLLLGYLSKKLHIRKDMCRQKPLLCWNFKDELWHSAFQEIVLKHHDVLWCKMQVKICWRFLRITVKN